MLKWIEENDLRTPMEFHSLWFASHLNIHNINHSSAILHNKWQQRQWWRFYSIQVFSCIKCQSRKNRRQHEVSRFSTSAKKITYWTKLFPSNISFLHFQAVFFLSAKKIHFKITLHNIPYLSEKKWSVHFCGHCGFLFYFVSSNFRLTFIFNVM